MSKLAGISRAALLGTLCAMVAFSYAIATTNESASVEDGVGSRGVGTSPLHFTNAKTAGGDRDLGDVVLGSAFTRFALAAGGLRPYTFSSPAGNGSPGISGLVNTILTSGAVDFSGKVFGSLSNVSGGSTSLRFNVRVDSAVGTDTGVAEIFVLTLDNSGKFKFANDNLGSTVRYQDFATQIDTINGAGKVTYAATAVSGISGVTTLSDIGLFLDSTGKLFGKPFKAGTLAITVTATDSNTTKAAGRDGTGTSQTFALVIEDSSDFTSDAFFTNSIVKHDVGAAKDSVSVKGIVNLNGASVATVANKTFTLQIGNFVGPVVTFDAKGKGVTAKGIVPTAKVAIKKFGLFTAAYTKLTLAGTFATATGTTQTLPTGLTVSGSVSTSSPLIYAVKTSSKGAVTLTYKGDSASNPAGAFLLTKVTGADDKLATGTAFKVAFVGVPGGDLSTITKSAFSFGNLTDSSLTPTFKNGKVSAKGVNKVNNTVKTFSFDSTKKGKGSITTNLLLASSTGIPLAGAPTTSTKIPVAVTLGTSTATLYNGLGSTTIVAKKTKYSSQ